MSTVQNCDFEFHKNFLNIYYYGRLAYSQQENFVTFYNNCFYWKLNGKNTILQFMVSLECFVKFSVEVAIVLFVVLAWIKYYTYLHLTFADLVFEPYKVLFFYY